jgi:hypothetical protein
MHRPLPDFAQYPIFKFTIPAMVLNLMPYGSRSVRVYAELLSRADSQEVFAALKPEQGINKQGTMARWLDRFCLGDSMIPITEAIRDGTTYLKGVVEEFPRHWATDWSTER